ncbi:hypothetical protein GCM10025875_32940 [Litorihabitans aurantiacus]|uniref:DUF11 domain-containing protein n=1 Tax=Litorihabitans aurantiacus TaxID=1930061 RepID=A0AA37XH76_9MICO|nr:hypothetical protein GCM10025875_32940 [Litorihabitans aurantiacus]
MPFLVVALVAVGSPAIALRFADATTAGTQTFPAVSQPIGTVVSTAAARTGTWSASGGTTVGVPGLLGTLPGSETAAWPWAGPGTTADHFRAAPTEPFPAAPVAQTFRASCGLLALSTTEFECLDTGTITLTFAEPVTDPLLSVAGLGGQESTLVALVLLTLSTSARLTIAGASDRGVPTTVTFGDLHSSNAPSGAPSLRVAGGRLEASAARASAACGALVSSLATGHAGCGRVRLVGTFTSVTFSVSASVSVSGLLSAGLTPGDTFHLSVALQDQPVPTASAVHRQTTPATAVTADLVAAATPAVVPSLGAVPLVPAATTLVGSTGWSLEGAGRRAVSSAGTVTLAADGVATFRPAAGFVGDAPALTYAVADEQRSTAAAPLTFRVEGPGSPLACATTMYQLGASGEVRALPFAAVGEQAAATSEPLLPAIAGTTQANALGVAADGSALMYVATRDGATVLSRYDTGSGLYSHTPVVAPDVLVAGAVSPVTGHFYYGGAAAGAPIYMVDAVSGDSFQVGTSPGAGVGNGDYAFTSAGDLHIVSDDVVTAVPVAALPTTAGTGPLAGTEVSRGQFAASNGIAFAPDGFLHVNNVGTAGAPSVLQRVDAVTGAVVGRATTSTFAAVDLGSCAPTRSIRVAKDVVARVRPTDQFTVSSALDASGDRALTATTSGATTGVQPVVAGPRIGQVGRTYHFSETGAGSPSADLSDYDPSWRCTDEDTGALLTEGSGSIGTYTVVDSSPLSVVCTVVNAPRPVAEVVKTVETGSATAGGGAVVAYVLTLTNDAATPALVDHDDVLDGVLDDADWPVGPGGDPVPPMVVAPGGADLEAVFLPAAQRVAVTGTLAPGSTATIRYEVRVRSWEDVVAGDGDAVLRNAVVRAGEQPPVLCEPHSSTCTETPLASYDLVKRANPVAGPPVDPGDRLTYEITVTSHERSTGPVTDVQIVDTLTEVLDHATLVAGSVALAVGASTQPLTVEPAYDPATQQWTLTTPAFTLPRGRRRR